MFRGNEAGTGAGTRLRDKRNHSLLANANGQNTVIIEQRTKHDEKVMKSPTITFVSHLNGDQTPLTNLESGACNLSVLGLNEASNTEAITVINEC